MLKKTITAAVLGLGLGVFMAPLVVPVSPASAATTSTAEELAAMKADIEGLIAANAGDEAAVEAAIKEYVAASDDPEGAAQALIAAVTNPESDAAKQALQNNAGLKSAAARGLGAAIALIAVDNPEVAGNMQAIVENSNDPTLVAAVSAGNEAETESITEGGVEDESAEVVNDANNNDTTPEGPASPN